MLILRFVGNTLLVLGEVISLERTTISDNEWPFIQSLLTGLPSIRISDVTKCRQFIGMESRTVFLTRYSRWYADGACEKLLDHFVQYADLQDVSIDGTINRAHARAAAGYQVNSTEQEALGRLKVASVARFMQLMVRMAYP